MNNDNNQRLRENQSQSCGERGGYVFISYKREEVKQATRIRKALLDAGFKVWWDADIQCGQVWNEVLDDAITQAACVVVLWSERSTQSRWVMHEASRALDRGVYAPVRIEMCRIEPPYDRLQATDIVDWDGETDHPGVKGLLRHVDALVPPVTPPHVRALKWVIRNPATIASVLFAGLALTILSWQTIAARSQMSQMDAILTEQSKVATAFAEQVKQSRRLTHVSVRVIANDDHSFQRMKNVFKYWEAIIDKHTNTGGMSASSLKLTHSDVFHRIPEIAAAAITDAVHDMNRLISVAEEGDTELLMLLMKWTHVIENEALLEQRGLNTASDEYVRSLFFPASSKEADEKALKTISEFLRLYEDGSFSPNFNLGGSSWSKWTTAALDFDILDYLRDDDRVKTHLGKEIGRIRFMKIEDQIRRQTTNEKP